MRAVALALAALGFAVSSATAGTGTVVKTAYNKQLKAPILVDARGLTIYYYVEDTGGKAFCVDDSSFHCSKHWIPLRTTGQPTAGAGVKNALLGTITRDDGTTQVTYGGRPLYTWKGGYGSAGDRKAGQLNGQGFLQLWYVLSAAGKPIKKVP